MPDKNPDMGPAAPEPSHLLQHTAPPGLKRWGRMAVVLAVAIAALGIGWRVWKSYNTAAWTDEQAVQTVQVIKLKSGIFKRQPTLKKSGDHSSTFEVS